MLIILSVHRLFLWFWIVATKFVWKNYNYTQTVSIRRKNLYNYIFHVTNRVQFVLWMKYSIAIFSINLVNSEAKIPFQQLYSMMYIVLIVTLTLFNIFQHLKRLHYPQRVTQRSFSESALNFLQIWHFWILWYRHI